jgi:DinB superfamily
MRSVPQDVEDLLNQLDAIGHDAEGLSAGLSERAGTWHTAPGCWSVAECLEHLAITNGVYLAAMSGPAVHARKEGRLRAGPIIPGFVGRWFVRAMEPPVRSVFKIKAPHRIVPGEALSVANAFARFRGGHDEVRKFFHSCADLDLATIKFSNPFVPGIRFSLATGLHVVAAHERRHLWQAWRVRRWAEEAAKKCQAQASIVNSELRRS